MVLAKRVAKEGEKEAIQKVITLIDEMVATLKEEEESDLSIKEKCEEDRAEDARKVATTARSMDEMSDEISKLMSEIEELKAEIEEKKEAIKALEEELKEATRIREDEKAAWEIADKEDEEAIDTVASATEVLESFYASKLIQLRVHKKGQDPPLAEQIKAGAAPPPPPPTWTEGETDVKSASEGNGIISILGLVKEDITKDKADAKAAEEKAQEAYDKFKEDAEASITTLQEDISTLEGEIGEKEEAIGEKEQERLTAKGELGTVMKKIKEAEPGCDFATVHYAKRVEMRQIEIDGLEKAKAILEGAEFPSA
jgi:chromosome segregation ATPase